MELMSREFAEKLSQNSGASKVTSRPFGKSEHPINRQPVKPITKPHRHNMASIPVFPPTQFQKAGTSSIQCWSLTETASNIWGKITDTASEIYDSWKEQQGENSPSDSPNPGTKESPGKSEGGEKSAPQSKDTPVDTNAEQKGSASESEKLSTKKFKAGESGKTSLILEEVGEDPKKWYGEFTSIKFLDTPIYPPIHVTLAKHLKKVEKQLADKYGEGDPKKTKEYFGLTAKSFPGGRSNNAKAEEKASVSMHSLGLALDIDPENNPWAVNASNKKSVSKAEQGVYKEIGLLINGEPLSLKIDFKLDKQTSDKLDKALPKILKLDRSIEEYFKLVDGSEESDAKLKQLLEKAKENSIKPWSSRSEKKAKECIKQHLKDLGQLWRRKNNKEVVKGGFLSLSEEFIRGMDMYWGGLFGDMMHFDLRDRGIGKKLYRAVQRDKAKYR